MYCERVILEKLARFRAKYGWTPVEHSIEEVEKVNRYFKSLCTTEDDGDTYFDDKHWTKQLRRWVDNERAMCTISFEYYLTRYHFIAAENQIFRFRFRGGQRVLFNVIKELEARGVSIEIMLLKARQGGFCLDPDTKVLTSDLRWVRIDDIQPGDKIVAVDEHPPGGRGPSRKMRLGFVEAKNEVFEQAVRIGFEDGSHLISTPHHKFMGKKYSSSTETKWREVRSLGIGDEIRYITREWGESTFEDGWFGGIIDGEGTVRMKPHSGAEVTVSQVEGKVLDRARKYLLDNGYIFREDIDKREPGENSKFGNKNCHRLILTRMDEIMRLIGKTRPIRMAHEWWMDKDLPGKRSAIGWRKIVSLEVLPPRRMIDLQTSTKTFIAGGYVSHNSTFCEALMTHRALFVPGVKCSIGSADDQKTYVMMGMMYTALEHLPWWLPPTQTKDKRSGRGLLEFAHVGSSIVVQSGSMRGGIGQGTTPTAIHLSEVCDYTDPLVQIEEGLFKAVHTGPEILMILESTGNGNTGWWAEQWRNNKEFYFQGRSRLYPLFIPWFMTPELYPKKEWIDKFNIPENWNPSPETRATIAKCEAYARNAPAIRAVLGDSWTMPREQQWFWEFNYDDAKRRRTVKSWLRHMPCDDFEALTGENDSVFDWDTIAAIQTRRKKAIDVYGIIGEGMAEKHDPAPADVDYERERIVIPWKTPGEVRLEWVMMPLTGDPEGAFEPMKKLLVYEHPEPDAQYSVGVDPGTGVGGDRTIITVTKNGRDENSDVQVAEFSSDDISNVEIYVWVAAIAAYYGKYMEDEQPRIVIEQRRKYGDSCYHALKLHGFRNHHKFREYDKKTLRPRAHENQREGWFTNAWSRPMLLNMFKYAVDNGWFEVNSRWLLEEIEGFEQETSEAGKTRMDHMRGKHDDRIFAAAMSYFTLHDLDVMAERAKKKYNKATDDGYDVDYSPWVMTVPNPGAEAFFEQFAD